MPKLLDFIKEKEFTHDQVIEILTNFKSEEDSEEEEEADDEEEEEELENEEEEDTTNDKDDKDDEPKTFTLKDVEKLISKALESTKKAKRKAPSKGKKQGTGTPTKRIYSRDEQFEEFF